MIFQDFTGPGILKKKSRTFQKVWEPCILDFFCFLLLCLPVLKYADDTDIIIPASNSHTRSAEIDNVEHWAQTNNLKLNRQKFKEIVFVDNKRKWNATPPPMQGIT